MILQKKKREWERERESDKKRTLQHHRPTGDGRCGGFRWRSLGAAPAGRRRRRRRGRGRGAPLVWSCRSALASRCPVVRAWGFGRGTDRGQRKRERERERRRHGYFGLAQIERERKSDREIERRNCDSIFYYCVVGMVGLVYIYYIRVESFLGSKELVVNVFVVEDAELISKLLSLRPYLKKDKFIIHSWYGVIVLSVWSISVC